VLLSVFVQLASGPDVGAFWLGPALVSGVIVGGGDQEGVIVMPAHPKPSVPAPCCFLVSSFLCSVFLVPPGLSGLVFVTSRL
jgi:hypothetical protein